MKITLSKRKRGEKRHVVLVADPKESAGLRLLIFEHVLNREVMPSSERLRNGSTRWRFAMKYLDDLTLTFPHAELSAGIISKLSTQAAAELELLPVPELDIPGFIGELLDFQKISVGMASKRTRFCFNDEMGGGKGPQLLATIQMKQGFPALVVVPNSIKYNWEREGHKFTDSDIIVVDGAKSQKAETLSIDTDVTIINCEGLRVRRYWADDVCYDPECYGTNEIHSHEMYEFKNPWVFFEEDVSVVRDVDLDKQVWREWRLIALDEYHRFKNGDSQMACGLHMLEARYKYVASGTPMLNGRVEELWSVFHWMWPSKFPTLAAFKERYCIMRGSTVVAYKNLKELRTFFHSRSIRRRREHFADELPEVVMVDDYVDLTGEQRRLYDEIRDNLRLWVDERPRSIVSTLAQMTRLKQACFSPELYDGGSHSAKLDRLREIVNELVASGEKAIVFSQWSKATRIIERELAQYNPAYIDGSVKPKDRMDQVDKFNQDEDCKIFVGTVGACKEGFTLNAATYVIHMDEGWVPAEKMQATARSAAGGLRGVGTTGSVHVITIRANDTIEEDIDKLLARKQQMNDRMVERDAGAQVERITLADLRELIA